MSRDDGRWQDDSVDDRLVDALLRGLATGEASAASRRVHDVTAAIRAEATRPSSSPRRWHRWFIGSAAGLASAAVVTLSVLLVRSPEAGAATVLERAVAVAGGFGPRSYRVEIDHRGGRPADPGVEGVLDLLVRADGPMLVRLEVGPRGAPGTDHGGGRAMGRDAEGAWVTGPDGLVERVDADRWARHLLAGTAPLVADDLAGLLGGLPRDHEVLLDEDEAGRPRVVATRRTAAESPDPSDRPRRPGEATRGAAAPSPPPPPSMGPPRRIEVVLDPDTYEIASLRFVWPSSERPRGRPSVGREALGPARPERHGPPPPAEIRLERIAPRGTSADWFSPSDS